MVNTPVDINQVKQLAATGHFRSVALWLNYPLVPQSIYAQVQADQYPGYLRVLLEFERPPKQETLVRVVCNRLCQLDSTVIRGIYLVGRLVATKLPLWQQRVRLPQRKPQVQVPGPQAVVTSDDNAADGQQSEQLMPSDPVIVAEPTKPQPKVITATTYGSEVRNVVPSYLIPRESNTQERRRRQKRTVAPFPLVQIRPTDLDSTKTSAQRRIKRRRLAPKEVIDQQFNYLRAIVVTGSAAAAFILGCVTEAMLAQRGQLARKTSPSLPTFNSGGWRSLSDLEAQEIAYRAAMRGPTVPAALEPIAVMPHEPSSDPTDPTVTLVFGGEVPVGDVPLQTPDAVEQVLGELEVFRDADVAMVGLGNSLASADTSLQESYFNRTRSDASDALLKGGIDIVGLTGDQTMDFGRQGLIETLETLDSAGIYRVGAGRDPREARRPEVLEVKGQRIAYLSYVPESEEVATLGQAGLNIQERDSIIEDIAALRQGVDWIVVNYRWYGDLTDEPNETQVRLSRSAIDAGADLVVGYHPEQLQGAEIYKSRPIVYSLGDFIFQDAPLENHDTATLRVSLREKQMKVEFLPVSVRDARPQAASGETAKAILKQIRQASEVLASPLQFPVILEAVPQSSPLLKPNKPVAPIKTLGELEPGLPSDGNDSNSPTGYPAYVNDDFPGPEGVAPDPFVDDFIPNPDSWEHNSFEDFNLEPDNLEPKTIIETQGFDSMGVEGDFAPVAPTEMMSPSGVPLDSFDSQLQPNDAGFEEERPHETWGTPKPPTSVPKVISDDVILSPIEQPLPGYDSLEGWGEKSSPHKEFHPIQEHLDSFEPSLESSGFDQPSEELSTEVADDTDTDLLRDVSTQDAISPHDEPLVGPLS